MPETVVGRWCGQWEDGAGADFIVTIESGANGYVLTNRYSGGRDPGFQIIRNVFVSENGQFGRARGEFSTVNFSLEEDGIRAVQNTDWGESFNAFAWPCNADESPSDQPESQQM